MRIYCLLVFIGFLLTGLMVYGQDSKRDSLYADLDKHSNPGTLTNDTSRMNTLNKLASYYSNFSPDSALIFYDQAKAVGDAFLADEKTDSQLEKAWIELKKGEALR